MGMPHSHESAQFYLAKVADFGCAQPIYQPISNNVATMEPFDFKIGTLHYTAPEVLRCRKHGVDSTLEHPQKIDVYSFGVIAYQVITEVTNIYPKGLVRASTIRDRIMEGSLQPDHNLRNGSTVDDERLSLFSFMQSCSVLDPAQRPSFPEMCGEAVTEHSNWPWKKRKTRASSSWQSNGETDESI